MTEPSDFLDTLHSYLSGLEERGHDQVTLQHPFPTASTDTGRSSSAETSETTASKQVQPILPAPKLTSVVPKDPGTLLSCTTLIRMPACGDTHPADTTRILLLTDAAEWEDPCGPLLKDMLKAIGYEPEADPTPWTPDMSLADKGARVLAMGNPALQAASTAGMDLQIVRGMWQQTPHGKLIATFPPSYLENNPAGKKAAWKDLQSLLKDLQLEVPAWTREKLNKKN